MIGWHRALVTVNLMDRGNIYDRVTKHLNTYTECLFLIPLIKYLREYNVLYSLALTLSIGLIQGAVHVDLLNETLT